MSVTRLLLTREELRDHQDRHGADGEEGHDEQDDEERFHTGRIVAVTRPLIVKCTAGADDPERCAQAFTVAATAAASGAQVTLWLTGEAAWFGVPGKAEEFVLPHSAPLAELRDTVISLGQLTVCTQCAQRRGITDADLLAGVQISGSASFVDEILRPEAQAVVY
jgi:predicted peroxiredoxin